MDSITSELAASTLGGKKFKIQQSIPSGSIKKGPHAIVRSADLNDGIEIKRRFGEGSKPLFARDDIAVNQTTIDTHCSAYDQSCICKSHRRSPSADATSTEKCHRENKQHSSPTSSRRKSPVRSRYNDKPSQYRDKRVYNTQTDRYKRRDRTKSPSPSRLKKKPPEKLPYYRDEVRERDRLRRLYGYSRSRSPDPSAGKKGSPIRKRRAETPPRRHSTSKERHSRRSTSRERHSRPSTSRERHSRSSPFRSFRKNYRSRRSRTPSRIRIPQSHEHHKHTDKDIGNGHNVDSSSVATTVIPATPQYIPIPVAVPADYAAYSFPGWPSPQPPFHPAHRPPTPSHFAAFPMWPMMPPMRPPHQTPFIGIPPTLPYTPMIAQYRLHASQRYPSQRHNMNNYQARPKKTSS